MKFREDAFALCAAEHPHGVCEDTTECILSKSATSPSLSAAKQREACERRDSHRTHTRGDVLGVWRCG